MIAFSLWYLIIGFLLGNGMPHFVFGRARQIFRSPFGRASQPSVNVIWGLANFIVASLIVWWRVATQMSAASDLLWLLIGFWLAVLMFGLRIKDFLPSSTSYKSHDGQ